MARTVITCTPEPISADVLAEIAQAFDTPAAREKTSTSDGVVDAVDVAQGGHFFRVTADGTPVAFYVLGFHSEAGGVVATVRLAHGRAGFDLVENVLPLIERQCHECVQLRMETRRRGLIKKLRAAGYHTTSVTLRKSL